MKLGWQQTLLAVLALTAACERNATPPTPTTVAQRPAAAQTAGQGEALYRQHCAQCHGPSGQGHPDWQTPSDGSFAAAPPLDANGNAPRRTQQQLMATIKQGVRKGDVEVMPGWGARLSDDEIAAVIAWFQSFWPAEIYQSWLQHNASTSPSADHS